MAETNATSRFKSNEDLTCKVETVVIPCSDDIVEIGLDYYQKKIVKDKLYEIKDYLASMSSQLKEHLDSHCGVIAVNNDSYYIRDLNAVIPKPSKISGGQTIPEKYANEQEVKAIIALKDHIAFGELQAIYHTNDKNQNRHLCLKLDGSADYWSVGYNRTPVAYLPIDRFNNDGESKEVSVFEVMRIFLEKKIKPAELEGFDKYFDYNGYFAFSRNSIGLHPEKAYTDFKNDALLIDGRKWSQIKEQLQNDPQVKERLQNDPKIIASANLADIAKKYFCDCDKRRANFKSYDEALLYGNHQGHWDLADAEFGKGITVNLDKPFYARNPYRDIKKHDVIGIDFGTKSTVVVQLGSKGEPYLFPIGGNYSSPKGTDTENPTILHLCDFNSFITQYRAKAGRPETSYFDLTLSHTAVEELKNLNDKKNYYSFITSLKQWAATENEKMLLVDDKEKEIPVPPYLQQKDGDFDPVEIYAYYIGTTLNNMFQYDIFSEYLLSFPVTYEKAVRDKLCESFRKGLIKSLPNVLANDQEFLKKEFTVTSSTSEPAAYAVCALKHYGFKPEDEKEVHYYGVFDFGGGTTDFDFGLWRGASENREEKDKDYVIEHFGGQGLRYLGGENILEYLSFSVLSKNQDKLRKANIWFTFPRGEQNKFPGYETVINKNSEWANLNMHIMKDALRPFWEKHEGYEARYPENTLDNRSFAGLFNNDGALQSNISLDINLESLDKEIEKRVRDGVQSFMKQLVHAMKDRNPLPEKINIFLAGNSCKAEIVKTIFDEECGIYENDYREELSKRGRELEEKIFEIYPPLGTPEADRKKDRRRIETDSNSNSRPTGKTGVAIGLILSRPGSPILVKNENLDSLGEKMFSFLVGKNSHDKFKPVLNFESKMGKWVEFRRVNERTVEFYFTRDAGGRSGKLAANKTEHLIRNLPEVKQEAFIFIRPVSPSEFEYKVSSAENGKPLCKIEKIKLEESK